MVDLREHLGPAYIFVRRANAISQHNYDFLRRFDGACAIARVEGLPVTLLVEDPKGFISPFAAEKLADPIEREGELARRTSARDRCSRLGGVFAFADLDSCARANLLYGWDLATVRRADAFGTWEKYDMQIISVLRSPGLPDNLRLGLWETYWRGEPGTAWSGWTEMLAGQPGYVEPLWELHVDGHVAFEQEDRSPFD